MLERPSLLEVVLLQEKQVLLGVDDGGRETFLEMLDGDNGCRRFVPM